MVLSEFCIVLIKKEQSILATSLELKSLADERISEAEILSGNAKHEGVFYLAGYAIEFALKAVTCKRLGVEIYDKEVDNAAKGLSQKALNAFMTHNLTDLLTLSGLKVKFELDKATNSGLTKAWSELSRWNEQRRYDSGCSEVVANNFLRSSNTLLTWIKQHW